MNAIRIGGLLALTLLAACNDGDSDTHETGTETGDSDTNVAGDPVSVEVNVTKLGEVENCTGNFDATGTDNDVSHGTSQAFDLNDGLTYDVTVGSTSDLTSYDLPIHTDGDGYTWIASETDGYMPSDGDVIEVTLVPYFGGMFTCTRHNYRYDASAPGFKGQDLGSLPADSAQHIEVLADYTVKADDTPGMGMWGPEDFMKVEYDADNNAFKLVLHDQAPSNSTTITASGFGQTSFTATVVTTNYSVVDFTCTK